MREITMRSTHRTRLVWSWYWVGRTFTSSPYRAKLLQMKARLFGGQQGAGVIALGADYAGPPDKAAETLRHFLRHTSLLEALNGVNG